MFKFFKPIDKLPDVDYNVYRKKERDNRKEKDNVHHQSI